MGPRPGSVARWRGKAMGGVQETSRAARLRRGRDDRVEGRASRVRIGIGGPGMEPAKRERDCERRTSYVPVSIVPSSPNILVCV